MPSRPAPGSALAAQLTIYRMAGRLPCPGCQRVCGCSDHVSGRAGRGGGCGSGGLRLAWPQRAPPSRRDPCPPGLPTGAAAGHAGCGCLGPGPNCAPWDCRHPGRWSASLAGSSSTGLQLRVRKPWGALITTARRTFEDKVLEAIASSLSPEHRRRLDASLADEDGATSFSDLKADPGQPNLDNILLAAKRLTFVKQVALPVAACPDLGGPVARMFRRPRVRRNRLVHAPASRQPAPALYALFLAHRQREITDGLVDLLVEVVHKVGSQARKRVLKAFTRRDRAGPRQGRVAGQDRRGCLRAARGHGARRRVPCSRRRGACWRRSCARHKASGGFERQVHTVLRSSYLGHYRRMLPAVLGVLEFRSNNAVHRPVLDAIDWLRRTGDDGRRVIRPEDGVPIEGVVPPKWRDLILEADPAGGVRVNRANYEICVLTALRKRVRCKEIWVVGAGDPAPLCGNRRPAPDLCRPRRTRQGHQDDLPVPLHRLGGAAPRDPRRAQRGRELERRAQLYLLRQGRRGGQQPLRGPGTLRAGAAPAAELPGLREHADAANGC